MPLANLQDLTSANCKNTGDKVQNLTPDRLPVLSCFRITTLLRTRDAVGKFKCMVHPIPQRSLCCNIYIFNVLSKVKRSQGSRSKVAGQGHSVKVDVFKEVFYPIHSWEVRHAGVLISSYVIIQLYSFIQYVYLLCYSRI